MTASAIDHELINAAVAAMPANELSSLRQQAAKLFSSGGFPTPGHEDWKYTNLAQAERVSERWLKNVTANVRATTVDDEIDIPALAVTNEIDATWLIIRNGVVASADLSSPDLQSGLSIRRLSENLASPGDSTLPEIAMDTAMSAFNVALLSDGVHVRVESGVQVAKPLGVLQIDDPAGQVAQVRVVIEMGTNSALKIFECAKSAATGDQFTNSVIQVELAENANLNYVRLQDRSSTHIGTNRLIANLAQSAAFSHAAIDVGGSLSRNDVVARIQGRDADVTLNGLYLATDQQHIDNHTRVEHRVGPSTSHEMYRGILDGEARCVFNGQAVVFIGADGTDANQTNHNLLLSDRAEIDTKPELEIYADDVKCSHGATVGQLDERALFYLRSRGLDPAEARRLLIRAFAADVLNAVTIEEVREYLQSVVDQRLTHMLGERVEP